MHIKSGQLLVGIPTHKRPELLRKCLESIAAQTGQLPPISVFVADNDPNGREGLRVVEEIAAEYPYPISSTLVAEPGISAVRNAILDEARRTGADFIAMIDDDETASEQWLAELLKVQAEYGADVVGGPTIRDAPDEAPAWLRSPEAFGTVHRPTGRIDRLNSTSNVLLNSEALSTAGWPKFDLAYGLSGGGDAEYFLRLRQHGLSSAWSSGGATFEPMPVDRLTTAWFFKREFRYGNIGDRLGRKYDAQVAPTRLWAITNLAASPLLLILAMIPSFRAKALRRLGYSTGIIGSALGFTFLEYAPRHLGSANAASND